MRLEAASLGFTEYSQEVFAKIIANGEGRSLSGPTLIKIQADIDMFVVDLQLFVTRKFTALPLPLDYVYQRCLEEICRFY